MHKVVMRDYRAPLDDSVSTEASLWFGQRDKEYKLIKKLYTTDERIAYRQLAVFIKKDNLHKRLAAVLMYTPRGNVWFDVTTTMRVKVRGTLRYRKVSNDLARELLGVTDGAITVYMQSFREVMHEQSHRMKDERRYHNAMNSAPKDRKVGEFIMPANYGQIVSEQREVTETLENAYLAKKWG